MDVQIQIWWPERVDPQSVDPQSVEPQSVLVQIHKFHCTPCTPSDSVLRIAMGVGPRPAGGPGGGSRKTTWCGEGQFPRTLRNWRTERSSNNRQEAAHTTYSQASQDTSLQPNRQHLSVHNQKALAKGGGRAKNSAVPLPRAALQAKTEKEVQDMII